jgi:hypothetical protein
MGNITSLNACQGQPRVQYQTEHQQYKKGEGKGGIEAKANVTKLDFQGKVGGDGKKEEDTKDTTKVTVKGDKKDCGKTNCKTSASHPDYDPKNDPYLPSYSGYQQNLKK